jgi:LmbE family N-acetylglucosaminyl deacetylase
VLAAAFLAVAPSAAAQQLAPAGTGGIAALERALTRLAANSRVLIIAAHPDDEDSELLAYLSLGVGAEAAYLSLSRGEGGQNLIGAELGEALGVIRSGELLAARAVDGGRQFFTRAFDFGYSKSLAETERHWPPESLLADAMRVARRLRPQVLISVWSGTERDGHGQHQMAGVVARRLFEALRDSAWGPVALYQTTRFDSAGTTLTLPLGEVDPVAGRSYFQIAMTARSQHRTQDMGQVLRLGPSTSRLRLLASRLPAGTNGNGSLFAGADTTLPEALRGYAALIDSARLMLAPRRFGTVVPLLARALVELRRHAPAELRRAREPLLEEAIATAADVVADATADRGRVAPGQSFRASVTVWDAGAVDARVRAVRLRAPAGWRVEPLSAEPAPDGAAAAFFRVGRIPTWRFAVTVPAEAPLTEPYYLRRPLAGGLYDWRDAADTLRGDPFDPPLILAEVELEVAGTVLRLTREVSYRYGDQATGEVRKPLAVVPEVGVTVSPAALVWPLGSSRAHIVNVELTHGAQGRTEGVARLEVPAGWPAVPEQRFVLEGQDARRGLAFEVRAPAGLRPGRYEVRAVAVAGGRRYDRGVTVIDYPHIRPVAVSSTAVIRVEAASIGLPVVRRVGYVRGASDAVPEALEAVGLPVTVLSGPDLGRSDLSSFDVIVVGSRAYETDTALIANHARLLDYVRGGGRLVVQYQQYQFVQGGFAPLALEIGRPHDRVTDETSPVRALEPAHALFNSPNVITGDDWRGWVQERGLYFARRWDPAFRPLLEMGDPGERLHGGLLVARLGRGLYVYTGISFFRQIPAGVPGAYRLFMNLLNLTPASVP